MRWAAALALVVFAGCPGDDGDDGPPVCDGAAWTALGSDLEGAVLSVQGRAADDVWAVGGGTGIAGGLAEHWDGTAWNAWASGAAVETWWWVWTSPAGTTWMVGDGGWVARVDAGGQATVTELVPGAGDELTLFGVWGSGDDDVWIVGGKPDGQSSTHDTFVRRWNGATFETPAWGATSPRPVAFLKVWGSGPDDVWISGEGGTMLRWTGAATGFEDHSAELNTFAPATTVHGCSPTEAYAVAGQALYAWDGDTWSRRSEPVLGSAANGVSCGPGGVLVVGNAGLKRRWERASGAAGPWLDERSAPPTATDLHGAWSDPAGRWWAAGGNYNDPSSAPRRGKLGARGCPAIAPLN